ncbi:MAG: TIGR04255 family protein [Christensenellales bacterium]
MGCIRYEINPLVEVILQIRFPTILSINANDPVEFQEAIKKEFPIYQLSIEKEQEITFPIMGDTSSPSIVQKQQHKNHNFVSADGEYKINLTSGFLSISTLNYCSWEEILLHFEKPYRTFLNIYNPPFFERIGLRYINAFSKMKLNIENKKWQDLIKPMWLGAFTLVDESMVINYGLDLEYYFDDTNSRAKIHAGLGIINQSPEKVFIYDGDFIYIRVIKLDEFDTIVRYLHEKSKEFFSSVITDSLHNAMIPNEMQ